MKSYEMMGVVDEFHELHLKVPTEISAGKVKVIVETQDAAESAPSEDSLLTLVDQCKMRTGIEDLAHQHDHYLHGTAKKSEP